VAVWSNGNALVLINEVNLRRARLVLGGCLSCLSVLSYLSETLVYCGQTVGCIKIKLDRQLGLGPGHTVLDGDPAPPKGTQCPHFSAYVYYGKTAGSIKMPLRREVGLGQGDIVHS